MLTKGQQVTNGKRTYTLSHVKRPKGKPEVYCFYGMFGTRFNVRLEEITGSGYRLKVN